MLLRALLAKTAPVTAWAVARVVRVVVTAGIHQIPAHLRHFAHDVRAGQQPVEHERAGLIDIRCLRIIRQRGRRDLVGIPHRVVVFVQVEHQPRQPRLAGVPHSIAIQIAEPQAEDLGVEPLHRSDIHRGRPVLIAIHRACDARLVRRWRAGVGASINRR